MSLSIHELKLSVVSCLFVSDASLEKCLKSIEDKLKVVPLLVNTPLRDGKQFSGVVDLISMENLLWSDEGEGKMFANEKINEVCLLLFCNSFSEV